MALTTIDTIPRGGPAPDAESHYQRHLAPLAETFEAHRRIARDAYFRRLPLGIGGFAALTAAAFYAFQLSGLEPIRFTIVAGIMIGIFAIAYVAHPLDAYIDDVRTGIYPRIFSYFGPDFTYSRTCPWSCESLKASDLIPGFDEERLVDYVRGSYKGVPLEMVEAELIREVPTKDGTRKVSVFDGVLFVLTPKKKFSGRIVVRKDSGTVFNSVVGFFKERFQGLQRIRLEDPEFEKSFAVYGTDQIEARAVLTTSFMQRLLDLSRLLGDGDVDCSFFGDKLLIRVETSHDFFEPSSAFERVDFRRDFETVIEEMKTVFAIVDTLKLDQNIGL